MPPPRLLAVLFAKVEFVMVAVPATRRIPPPSDPLLPEKVLPVMLSAPPLPFHKPPPSPPAEQVLSLIVLLVRLIVAAVLL